MCGIGCHLWNPAECDSLKSERRTSSLGLVMNSLYCQPTKGERRRGRGAPGGGRDDANEN